MKVLIVTEGDRIASRVGLALRLRWPDLELAVSETAHSGRRTLAHSSPEVIFVSTALSDCDALTLVQEFRRTSEAVIFVVGSSSREADIAEALEAGADDYVSTLSSESLLVTRVCAALRRARTMTGEGGSPLKCSNVAIDLASHEAQIDGRPLCLTPTEFKLLYHLALHEGRVVTQQALESLIWGCSDKLYIDVLRKHVQRLRGKLKSPRSDSMTITTLPRVGYKLVGKKTLRSGR